jgi:hypothetical protein
MQFGYRAHVAEQLHSGGLKSVVARCQRIGRKSRRDLYRLPRQDRPADEAALS